MISKGGGLFSKSDSEILMELIEYGIVNDTQACRKCESPMTLVDKGEQSIWKFGISWQCHKSSCREEISIFRGSPIADIKIGMRTFYFLIRFYLRGVDIKTTKWLIEEVSERISDSTISRYFDYFRRVVAAYLSTYLPVIQVPGPVEIDETFIGAHRRGNHGRIPGAHLTVFGKFTLLR